MSHVSHHSELTSSVSITERKNTGGTDFQMDASAKREKMLCVVGKNDDFSQHICYCFYEFRNPKPDFHLL